MSQQSFDPIGRGIEVLVRKASVDPAFRDLLLAKRADAADAIELALAPAEAMMLEAVTPAQLEAIIARTTVPQAHRRAFLGKAAAAMLAALGSMGPGLAAAGIGSTGIQPDRPQPAVEPPNEPPNEPPLRSQVEAQVNAVIGAESRRPGFLPRNTSLADHVGAGNGRLEAIRAGLSKQFMIAIPRADFARLRTVGDLIDYIEAAIDAEPPVIDAVAKLAGAPRGTITAETVLDDDLGMSSAQRAQLRRELTRTLRVYISWERMRAARTVGDVVTLASQAAGQRRAAVAAVPYRPSSPPPKSPGVPLGQRLTDPLPLSPGGGMGGTRPGRRPPPVQPRNPYQEAEQLRRQAEEFRRRMRGNDQ